MDLAQAKAAIQTLDNLYTTKTKFVDIEDEFEKTAALTDDVIKAIKALDPTSTVAEDKADVIEQYEDAAEAMELINAVIDAYADYQDDANALTIAALKNAYLAAKEAGLDNAQNAGYARELLYTDGGSNTTAEYNKIMAYYNGYNQGATLVAQADAAKITAATAALTTHGNTTWAAFTGTDLTKADIETEIRRQVDAVLTAADAKVTYTLTGVDVPSLGKTEKVYFQINFTDGSNVGNNSFDVTNNYSDTSIEAAVKAKIGSTASVTSYPAPQDLTDAVIAAIAGTNTGISNVSATMTNEPASWTANTMVYYSYTFTFNGVTYTDTTSLKLVA